MKIEIINKSIEAENVKEVKIKSGKNEIIASKESDVWNSDGINDFLINVGISVPENEELELIYNPDDQDSMYKFLVELFDEFVKEYNASIKEQNINN